ncbi:MAG: cation transporter [Rhodospirillaceae bacterium]|nr:cation transporter [Rhodospirillaceae bacterium]
MSAHCHHHTAPFDGASAQYRRVLMLVIVLNGGMFVAEIVAGALANSMALQADAMDFAADAATYALTLAMIGRAARWRSGAALLKGASLAAMGVYVLGATVWRVFVLGAPEPIVMGAVGAVALAVNVASALLLFRFRDGDANVRSVWLCSRNDAIGNVAVMLAALGVFGTGTAWPDLAVAAIMAGLFLYSSVSILRQALAEWRAAGEDHAPHRHASGEAAD